MNKSESKYFATAKKMDEALLALLEKKEFAYITVKELCQAAGVNRSTFYLHYETIGDLLDESMHYMNTQFLTYMKQDADVFIAKLQSCPLQELYLLTPEYLTPYLSYISAHKRLFRTALENSKTLHLEDSYAGLSRHVLIPILERYGVPEPDREYLLVFYVHGIMAIIGRWLQRDCADSIEHVVVMIQKCVRPHQERV